MSLLAQTILDDVGWSLRDLSALVRQYFSPQTSISPFRPLEMGPLIIAPSLRTVALSIPTGWGPSDEGWASLFRGIHEGVEGLSVRCQVTIEMGEGTEWTVTRVFLQIKVVLKPMRCVDCVVRAPIH